MKNNMMTSPVHGKKIAALAAVLVSLLLLLAACGGDDSGSGSSGAASLNGTWKLVSMSGTQDDTLVNNNIDNYIMVIKDGNMKISGYVMGENQARERSFRIDGSQMYIDGHRCDFTLSGKTLTITEDGITAVLEKQ